MTRNQTYLKHNPKLQKSMEQVQVLCLNENSTRIEKITIATTLVT
jgi:hypothetical protein